MSSTNTISGTSNSENFPPREMITNTTDLNTRPEFRYNIVAIKYELRCYIADGGDSGLCGCLKKIDTNRQRLLAANKTTDAENDVLLSFLTRIKGLVDYSRLLLAELEKLCDDEDLSAELRGKYNAWANACNEQHEAKSKLCELTGYEPDNVLRLVTLAREFPSTPVF
ncbi:hypothetical protein HD806DRAFT_521267 [Xylariaceae sp. AK1471]|nr:hypothetical protein HD806DRAFT_521267 [Xylariaceae sp. AK1471]